MACRNIYFKFLLIAALFFSAAAGIFAAEGDLDPTFDGDGVVVTDGGSGEERIEDLAVQPDGKIIAVGYRFPGGGYIIRYNPNGSIDSSFGTNGSVSLNLAYTRAVALQSDGKILVSGSANFNGTFDFYVARLNPNGSFDTTFNAIGSVIVDIGGFSDGAESIKIQPDGKIVAGGSSSRLNCTFPCLNYALLRLNTDGTPDKAFGFNGRVTTRITPRGEFDNLVEIALQTDGKILATGTARLYDNTGRYLYDALTTLRYNPNGSLDTTFDGDGIILTDQIIANGIYGTVVVQPNGKIVAGGRGLVARYDNNGLPDHSFGNRGMAPYFVVDAELQSDNKIIFAIPNGTMRLNSNGSLDLTYSGDGISNIPLPNATVNAVAIQPDGKIVVCGYVGANSSENLMLARFEAKGRTTTSDFDGDGKTDFSVFRPSTGGWYGLRSSDGSFFGQQAGSATDKIVPADYTGDGKTDIAFFRPSDNTWNIIRSENQTFYALPYAAPGDIPAPADFDGDGKADITIFRPSNSLWVSLRSSDGNSTIFAFGSNGDIPVPADYDGDGKADFSVYRPSAGEWYTWRSTTNTMFGAPFGAVGDLPVQGDYTGDGKTDFAIFRPSTNFWYVLRSENQSFYGAPFASPGDIPVTGDYDGDGKNDFAVYRPSTGNWFIMGSRSGFIAYQFGDAGDKPVPAYYLP